MAPIAPTSPNASDATASPAGVDADTTITINHGSPAAQNFRGYTASRPQPVAQAPQPTPDGVQRTETTTVPAGTKTVGPRVNWGRVAKGALIVTAVVVAAAVVTPMVAHWVALHTGTWLTALNGGATTGPILGAVQTGAMAAWHGITALTYAALHGLANGAYMLGHLLTHLGVATPVAGHVGLSSGAISGISNATGWAAGAGAVAIGGSAALPAVAHSLHGFVDPATAVATPAHVTTTTTVTGHAPHDAAASIDDGVATSMLAAKKATLMDSAHQAGGQAEMGHHAADMAHHASTHDDHERAHRDAMAGAQRATRQWVDRVGQEQADQVTGQGPRAASFTEQLNTDRANLDAALAH